MGTLDNQVGSNVKRIREALGMSQAEVAERMTADGCPAFYPQTILKVEKGIRSLKLTEADSLARVLSVSMSALIDPYGPATKNWVSVGMARRRVDQLRTQYTHAVARAEASRDEVNLLATDLAEAEAEAERAASAYAETYPDTAGANSLGEQERKTSAETVALVVKTLMREPPLDLKDTESPARQSAERP